jgi:exocyst complex protein 7
LKEYFQSILADSYIPIDAAEYVKQGMLYTGCWLIFKAVPLMTGAPMPRVSDDNVSVLKELFRQFDLAKQRVDDIFVEYATRNVIASLSPLASAGSKVKSGQYDKTNNPIVVYSDALNGFLQARLADLEQLFPENSARKLYFQEQIFNICLSKFLSMMYDLNDHVATHLQADSLVIFDIAYCVVLLLSTTDMGPNKRHPKLVELLQKVRNTTKSVFAEFLRYIETRVQNLATLPSDNGVTEATMDVMSRMRKLSEDRDSATVLMENLAPSSWIPTPKPTWASMLSSSSNVSTDGSPWSLLSEYFSDAIDDLVLNLELKSKALARKNSQTGLLMLINLTFIETSVKRSKKMQEILGSAGAERLQRLRKHSHDLFLEGWKAAAAHLMDVTVVRSGNKTLTSKDREAIKEKFRAFNSEFEMLVQRQKSYNLTDAALRQELTKEIRFISPLYHRFYDRHRGGEFTKNVEKYIKYDKEQFDSILASLE